MKRIIALILSFSMIFVFASCANNEALDENTTAKESKPQYELQTGEDIHTIALVSDTQKYDESTYNKVFESLVNDKATYNIEYVVHTGDLIQEGGDLDAKWQVAKNAISKLDGIIPYGVLAGNHDQDDTSSTPFAAYSKYFGDETYKGYEYFAGSYDDCQAHAQLITIGSNNFIFVYISDEPDIEALKFAGEMLDKYSDRIGVICTHKYLGEDLEVSDSGELIFSIVKSHSNVKMVLCGHESVAGVNEVKLDDGRTVLQIIADYQDARNNGTMMYLQINEAKKTLTGISYNPLSGSYDGYESMDTDQFEVSLPW